MNILFYTVANKRSRDIESQAIEFAKQGDNIFLLTQSPRSELHEVFQSYGFYTASTGSKNTIFPLLLIREVARLVLFCYRHKITLVHSHLDPCNLIAVCSQLFLRAHVVVTRHHADALAYEASPKSQRISRWIYRTARHIVVVSESTKKYMMNAEGIEARKITAIPLAFNFDLYTLPADDEINAIKDKYGATVLLCTVGRLTKLKRIDEVIRLVYQLKKKGLDVNLLVVGGGPEITNLSRLVKELNLSENVFLIGFTERVLPFIAAADYYVHFSITEASCTTVKEAALVAKPVIVCSDVGDFNEYISPPVNGFIVSKDAPLPEACDWILKSHNDKEQLNNMGRELKMTVQNRFDIKKSIPHYNSLHQQILKP